VRYEPRYRESLRLAGVERISECVERDMVIEVATLKVPLLAGANLQLAALLGSINVDTCILEAAEVCWVLGPINNVESFVTLFEPFLHEGQEHPILLLRTVKEGADVTRRAKHGSGQPHQLAVILGHVPSITTTVRASL
jgi:hypothetical protein